MQQLAVEALRAKRVNIHAGVARVLGRVAA